MGGFIIRSVSRIPLVLGQSNPSSLENLARLAADRLEKTKEIKNQCAKVKARTRGCLETSMKILKTFDSFNDFSIHVGVGLWCTKQDIAIGVQNQCHEYRFGIRFGLFTGMKYFDTGLFRRTILKCFGLPILYILHCIYIYIYILFYIKKISNKVSR